MTSTSCDIVVPTVGRPSLWPLLVGLGRQLADRAAEADGGPPAAAPRVIVVDDRPRPSGPAAGPDALVPRPDDGDAPPRPAAFRWPVEVVRSGGRGPAAARNVGWRCSAATWVAFLDDDVVLPPDWWPTLLADLGRVSSEVGGVQGRVVVPSPRGRRPTDLERDVAGLANARWATADMAYRRAVLQQLGGFDERFPRAYREDADLALRTRRAGYALRVGDRHVVHPVRPAPWTVSIARQRGNADDALMRRLHGRTWRAAADAPPGAFRQHLAVSAALVVAAAGGVCRRRRAATAAAITWFAGTARFTWRRVRPGPRTPGEVAAMAATSVAIPPVAVWHRVSGAWRARGAQPWRPVPDAARVAPGTRAAIAAVRP